MPEQPLDSPHRWQRLLVGSVFTFLDRHRRIVVGTVTELRCLEAIVPSGSAGG